MPTQSIKPQPIRRKPSGQPKTRIATTPRKAVQVNQPIIDGLRDTFRTIGREASFSMFKPDGAWSDVFGSIGRKASFGLLNPEAQALRAKTARSLFAPELSPTSPAEASPMGNAEDHPWLRPAPSQSAASIYTPVTQSPGRKAFDEVNWLTGTGANLSQENAPISNQPVVNRAPLRPGSQPNSVQRLPQPMGQNGSDAAMFVGLPQQQRQPQPQRQPQQSLPQGSFSDTESLNDFWLGTNRSRFNSMPTGDVGLGMAQRELGHRRVVRSGGPGSASPMVIHPMAPNAGFPLSPQDIPEDPAAKAERIAQQRAKALQTMRDQGLTVTPEGTVHSFSPSQILPGEDPHDAYRRMVRDGEIVPKYRRRGSEVYSARTPAGGMFAGTPEGAPRELDPAAPQGGGFFVGADAGDQGPTDDEAAAAAILGNDYVSQMRARRQRVTENAQARGEARRERIAQRNSPPNPAMQIMQQNPQLAMQMMGMMQRAASGQEALGLQREMFNAENQLGKDRLNLDREQFQAEQKNQLSPQDSAFVADLLDARERGEMTREEFRDEMNTFFGPNASGGRQRTAGSQEEIMPGLTGNQYREVVKFKEDPTGPDKLVDWALNNGKSRQEINLLLKEIFGGRFRTWDDPYGKKWYNGNILPQWMGGGGVDPETGEFNPGWGFGLENSDSSEAPAQAGNRGRKQPRAQARNQAVNKARPTAAPTPGWTYGGF